MVSLWSLSDSKSLQVSRTLLSILADLNNGVVSIVATRSFISKSSTTCTNSFGDYSERTYYTWYHRHFQGFFFCSVLLQSLCIYLFLLSFSFNLWSAGTAKSTIWHVLYFFVYNHKDWSSGRDKVIRLYLKIPVKFIIIITIIIIIISFPSSNTSSSPNYE